MTQQQRTETKRCPEGIEIGENGQYHWIYGLDMRTNLHPMYVLLKVLAALLVLIVLIMAIALTKEQFLWGIQIVIPCFVVAGIVVVLVFRFMRMLYDDVYYMVYDMDETGIRVTEVTEQAEKTKLLASAAAITGALTHQYGMLAVNAQIGSNTGTYSAFEQVRRVIIDPEHHFIGLLHPFTCNMIYADDPYYPMIRDEIIKRCVNAKIRFRNRS